MIWRFSSPGKNVWHPREMGEISLCRKHISKQGDFCIPPGGSHVWYLELAVIQKRLNTVENKQDAEMDRILIKEKPARLVIEQQLK